MAELTGLFGVDWLVVFLVVFGLAVAAMSLRRDVDGLRVGGLLVVPLLSGLLLVAVTAATFADNVTRFLPHLRRPVTLVIAAGAAFVAVAVADLLVSRLAPLPGRVWRSGSRARLGDLGLLVFVGGAVLVAAGGALRLGGAVQIEAPAGGLRAGLSVTAVHALPGEPLGLSLHGERDGYLSLGDRVARFELGPDGLGLQLATVAEGFAYSRGLTVAGDVLVVADLGPLPCPDPFPVCKGHRVPDVDIVAGDRRILEESRGRLVAFDIGPDGGLSNRRVLVDDLPVANTEHGVNGLVTGPDGLVYVAIGNLDALPTEEAATVDHPNLDLLGTVLRVAPDSGEVDVFARGLRNVYGLTFDDRGGLWGVDNDGETTSGWRAEEVVLIREGHHYGYPHDGSFGQHELRDDLAIWHIDRAGSAGVGWAGDAGLGPGLLIGSCGWLDGLRLTDLDGGWRVDTRADYAPLLDVPGCVTDIKAAGDGRLLVGVFGAQSLYVVSARG